MIAVVLAASILLGGCWNARDIEQLIYIDAIGVDYVNHKVVVYLQILGFSNIAKKESNTQLTREPVSVAKGEGDTYVSAIYQIYTTTQQRLIWSHVHSIVFTERALKHGKFDQVMDALDRYQEFRYSYGPLPRKNRLRTSSTPGRYWEYPSFTPNWPTPKTFTANFRTFGPYYCFESFPRETSRME